FQTYPTAMTSLAGLVFLASGSTPTRGPHARTIRRITDYLLTRCANTRLHGVRGLIYNPLQNEQRPMYCHAFGMTYLALVFGQEKDRAKREKIRAVLKSAIELTRRVQTDDGGWGYTPDRYEDEGTLVVTQLQGLRACRDAGLFVPKAIIDNAVRYIENSANRDGSVRYRVRPSPSRPGITCASVVALWQAGKYDDPLFRRIAGYVNRSLEPRHVYDWRRGHHAEYVLYYLSQSQHVQGGKRWERYYKKVSSMLLGVQRADGGWEGRDGGDIFGTTIALLILQLPYNRLVVYQR
ncbi:MAG: terpene cyclase/mutase family protein, partial [Planctomycetota bacterium]|nr:terpene cyclase/mutase family protein [Planctomycetota bacterium]